MKLLLKRNLFNFYNHLQFLFILRYVKNNIIDKIMLNFIVIFIINMFIINNVTYCDFLNIIISNPIDAPQEDYYGRDWDSIQSLSLYEEMNGKSDPNGSVSESGSDLSSNSGSESESGSNSDLETNILEKFSFPVIFNAFKTYIQDCQDEKEMMKRALVFMSDRFPPELLAKKTADIGDPNSPFNMFQEKATIPLNSADDKMYFISFRAAMSTYNTALLLDMFDHPEVIEMAYFATVQKLELKSTSS